MSKSKFNTSWLGFGILIAAFSVSLWNTWTIRKENYISDKKIIRIAHWQLELGYRDAMGKIIADYEKLNPDVKVLQLPISEKVYPQWVNTQLVGDTAPEILELGFSRMMSNDTYVSRYFLPLTRPSQQPNPYNSGTNLERLPWRETFADGMRGGYRETLQDYYGVPTAMFTIRMFYNKTLLEKAIGSSTPPETFTELLKTCEALREYGKRTGNDKLVPIAGNKYVMRELNRRYMVAFTTSYEDVADTDLDGKLTAMESYAAFHQEKFTFDSPKLKGVFNCLRELSDNFPPGFVSVGREMAAFMFVQGNAAFICSGSWDANSLFHQAKFDIGIIDFPLPAKGDRWGDLVEGRLNEAGISGGAVFGLNKYSPNRETALDFLYFLTSRKYNQKMNRQAGWIPIALGASASDRMKAFTPNPNGYVSRLIFRFGNYCSTIYHGQLERFLSGEIEYEEFSQKVNKALLSKNGGRRSWALEYDKMRRKVHAQEGVLGVQIVRQLFGSDPKDAREKYTRALLQQMKENNANHIKKRYRDTTGEELPEI